MCTRGVKALDEFLNEGVPQPAVNALWSKLTKIDAESWKSKAKQRDLYLQMQGITFTLSGIERPLPVDLIPRIIESQEWKLLEAGIKQRINALEAFLADVYGKQVLFKDRIISRKLVQSSDHFHRAAFGIDPENKVRVHVSGIDIVRDQHGVLRVLEDNLRSPSGVSYVLENRRTMAHVTPELFNDYSIRNVDEYPERLLKALVASAPGQIASPNVVLLTPGIHNSAHFEHAFLARRMGIELVEGRDLYCKNNKVYMRTTTGSEQVHVIYRRIDDDYLDPIHFKPNSLLGIPGIVNAARANNVAIANGIGNGVADDKALYPYVPAFIKYYLGEETLLPNVDTYDLQKSEHFEYVMDNLHELVVKPAATSGGYGIVIGPKASSVEIETVRKEIIQNPRNWIAQPLVALSTCPTVLEDGSIASRHIDFRPFAVNDGNEIWVLPGGLTRVALVEGNVVVNSSQGGGSKDTWVLSQESEAGISVDANIGLSSDPLKENFTLPTSGPELLGQPRLRQQEEQQQQGHIECAGEQLC